MPIADTKPHVGRSKHARRAERSFVSMTFVYADVDMITGTGRRARRVSMLGVALVTRERCGVACAMTSSLNIIAGGRSQRRAR